MNAIAVAEAINLALSGLSLLRTLGATGAEIKALLDDSEDQSIDELTAKLRTRQSEIESRVDNDTDAVKKKP